MPIHSDFVFLKKLLIRFSPPVVRRMLLELRDELLNTHAHMRMMMQWEGALPDFVVVGTQKGGTTQLYDELIRHPNIKSALVKEVHFFDNFYDKGDAWYRTFFASNGKLDKSSDSVSIQGEASPCYLFHPWAAKRMWETVPGAKIIVMLRDPVKRAYSHYHHEVRLGYELLSFEEAIAKEEERLRGEREKMLQDSTYHSEPYMHFSYLARGRYAEQLKIWYQYFPPEQILVLSSEKFYQDTDATLEKVLNFLEVSFGAWERRSTHKSFPYTPMSAEVEERLTKYFAPHNEQLYSLLNTDFHWKSPEPSLVV